MAFSSTHSKNADAVCSLVSERASHVNGAAKVTSQHGFLKKITISCPK